MSPVLGKLLWVVFNPANLLTGLLVVGAVLLFTRWKRTGRGFVAIATVGVLAVAYLPLGVWLIAPLETRFAARPKLPETITGIIVLGGAIDTTQTRYFRQVALNGRGERITTFVWLAKRYPEAKLVYTGGAGLIHAEAKSEAEAAKPLLVALGVAPGRLILETKSRDTHENAAFTRDLVKPKPDETWILVTSAAHMPRAIGAFRRAGWRVTPYPVDHRRLGEGDEAFGKNLGAGLNLLTAATREWLSLAQYYVLDRTDRFFPGPDDDGPPAYSPAPCAPANCAPAAGR